MAAFLFSLFFLCAGPLWADDFSLTTAGAPGAPIDVEQAHKDPFIPLTLEHRRDIIREFKALLSMGVQPASATQWVGRDIADCQERTSSREPLCRQCEVQMGNARANYLFYSAGSNCRLRDTEITVDSGDATLLRDLKPQARYYAGARDGQFYLDEDRKAGQSNLRFVWRRPKLN